MRLPRAIWVLTTCLSLLALTGCKRDEPNRAQRSPSAVPGRTPQTQADRDTVLATVNGVNITVGDLQDQINAQSPYLRPRYQAVEKQREFLQSMVRFEILAQEAARRGLDKDPDVIRTMKQVMIQKLMKAQFEQGDLRPTAIPEDELRKYFEEHKDQYNRSEQVRISAIILPSRGEANRVAALAKGEAGKSLKGFRELVTKHSADAASAKRGGDLGYLAMGSKSVPAPIIDAALELHRSGEVAGPIEAEGKFYIIKQTGKKKGISKTFAEVKGSLQNRLYRKKRAEAQKSFIESLRSKAKVDIDDTAFAKIRIDTSQPATTEHDEHQH